MRILEEALTFDDVLLVPAYSEVLPREVSLASRLTREISVNLPVVSAAMDTVTEARLAITIAQEGGIGIIHKNMSIESQARQVDRVKKFESGVISDPITVKPDMTIAKEEIFGPVLSVIRVKTLDEAINLVNRSPYGNATSIFTRNGKSAREYSSEIEVGMVGINVGVAAPMAFFTFAGWKSSFFGDLHAHGKDAVAFYTEQKVVMSRWY